MAKITLPDGTVFEGNDPKDAASTYAEFLKLKNAAGPESKGSASSVRLIVQPKIKPRKTHRYAANGYDTRAATLGLLEAIKAAGNRGVPGDQVMQIVHADHPKGIGGRMVRINGFLRSLGFEGTKDLFHNPRDRDSTSRVWKPKRNINAAIEAVRKAGN